MSETTEAPKSGCLQLGSSAWAIFVAGIIIFFMAAIATPKLIESRLPGNEAAAIGTLKFIESSQRLYKEQGHKSFGSLEELQREAMKGYYLKDGVKQGYRFTCQASKTQPSTVWWATAVPVEPGKTGQRHFLINQLGELYFDRSKPVVPDPESGLVKVTETVQRLGG